MLHIILYYFNNPNFKLLNFSYIYIYIYTVTSDVKISATCFNDPNLLGVSYFELNNISFYILLLLL